MKKIYFLIAAAFSVLTANAQFGMYTPPEFVESEWTCVGDGVHYPGILDWSTNEYPEALECVVYHSNLVPGDFWIQPDISMVNPEEYMAPGPYIVHLQNPDKVWTSPIWSGHPGVFCFYQLVPEIVPAKGSDANYGVYEDGFITFPANSYYFATMPTGEPYSNTAGNFMIELHDIDQYVPAYQEEEKIDYTTAAVMSTDFVANDWEYVGEGVHCAGIFDFFPNEYPEDLNCSVFASKVIKGDYWILPDIAAINPEEYLAPGPYIVHLQNPDKVWTNVIWAQHPMIFGFTQIVPAVLGLQGNENCYGKMEGNTINFPQDSHYWSTNPNGKSSSNINGGFTIIMPDPSGINDVNADASSAVFYNLQGIKVSNPDHGIYIMKHGNATKKVRF